MKKVVVAMGSFKGCLSSSEAEKAVEEGIKLVCPDYKIIHSPIADGGEEILTVLIEATRGTYQKIITNDPLIRPTETTYGIPGDKHTAFIEMTAVNGLPLLSETERNPMLTTTYGAGELILHAIEQGYQEFVIGIGGSAANDAGVGLLQALGARFLDKDGAVLGKGGEILHRIAAIDFPSVHPAPRDTRFTIACDVRNPFRGPEGAAHIFVRQKGADDTTIEKLDVGIQPFSRLIHSATGRRTTYVPETGTAGGLGGTFLAFLNAELKPGINLLPQTLKFSEKIKGADLIITGEGRTDRQSLIGKAPSGILEEAKRQGIPVIVVAGSIEDTETLNQAGFQGVFFIIPSPIFLEAAMKPEVAKKNICRTVAQTISLVNL